jgi:hypothetical protein
MFDMYAHLKSRYLDSRLHTVWVDNELNAATFPLWDLSGRMTGYQTYRPLKDKVQNNHPTEGRYYTYRVANTASVWGLESWSLTNTLFVTEGIFDAARLTYNGASAVALLSNDPSTSTLQWLRTVKQFRRVVAVCDDDAPGRKLRKAGNQWVTLDSHDLGDADDQEVRLLLKTFL